ncbi:MAG: hypothetical protein EOM45_15050 [Clostridia bacterium]|nr:hypothetical protein [Clostridia bacterium]
MFVILINCLSKERCCFKESPTATLFVILDAMQVDKVGRIMGIVPSWADGLILDAAGYETGFYMKD